MKYSERPSSDFFVALKAAISKMIGSKYTSIKRITGYSQVSKKILAQLSALNFMSGGSNLLLRI